MVEVESTREAGGAGADILDVKSGEAIDFVLDAKAPDEDARNLEVDRVGVGNRSWEGGCCAAVGIVDIGALNGLLLDERRVIDGGENEVTLRAFVEDTEAAADDAALFAIDVVGEADARSMCTPKSIGTTLKDAAKEGLTRASPVIEAGMRSRADFGKPPLPRIRPLNGSPVLGTMEPLELRMVGALAGL